MTRSNPRTPQVPLSAAFSRAVDLSALKRPPAPAAPAARNGASPAAPSPYVIDVTEATFGAAVAERSLQVLVIVDLWAEWCEPCKQLSPLLERIVAEFNGAVILAKVDVDTNPRISQAFGVQSIPTVVAIAGGQPVDAFTGAQPEKQVRAWVTGLVDALRGRLPGIAAAEAAGAAAPVTEPEVDPLVLSAEDALEQGDLDTAIAAYEKLTANNPGDADAALALAQLRFQQRAFGLPEDAVDRAAAEPDNTALQLDAADLEFATGQAKPAFDRLIRVIGGLPGDERGPVRDHLLELFALLGHADPLVVAARRKLAAALY